MPSLRIEIGGQVVHARLTDAVVRVGRDPSCDLRIDDRSVSATHVAIEPLAGGGHKLTDLNSGLPTKVNGFVVKRVSLRPGDVIEVGPARIVYDPEAAAAGPSPLLVTPPAPARPPAAPTPALSPPYVPPLPESARVSSPAAARASSAVAAVATVASPSRGAPVPSIPYVPPATATAVVPAPTPAAAASEDERTAFAPVATPASVRVRSSSSKLKAALVATGFVAVVLLVAAALIRNSDDTQSGLRELGLELERAEALASTDVDRAIEAFDRLARAPSEGIRRKATSEAEYWRQKIRDSDRDIADLEKLAATKDADSIATELALIQSKHGAALIARHPGLVERLEAARHGAAEARTESARQKSRALAEAGKLAEALDLWNRYVADAPGDHSARQVAEEERVAIDAKAAEAFKALAADVDEVSRKDGPRAAAMRLRSRLPDFAGTSVATAIALRAATLDGEAVAAASAAAAAQRAAQLASTPRPTATAPKGTPSNPASNPATGPSAGPSSGTAPTPTPAAPALPSPSSVNRARIVALLADVDAHAAARRFREALASLLSAEKFAEGTNEAGRLEARKDDLDLARRGVDLLIAAIKGHPERFQAVEIAPQYVVALVDADSDLVTAAVRGGRTQTRWSSFDAAHMATLVEAASVPAKDGLPLAALLREAGNRDAEERLLLRVIEAGGDKPAVDVRLARWRGEPVPSGGYVPYEGRLVSPSERERLALEARVAAACARVASPNAKERKAAYDELLSLDSSAKEPFLKALHARREAAAKEVAASKAFSSGRTKQHLLEELEKRRAAALALIENEKEYPYPYAPDQDERQKRVDVLVDAVREVWERPFDLVSQWDKSVEQSLGVVREVDEVLAKTQEGYVADLDAVKAEINKAIGVPSMLLDAYDKDVLAYNEKVPTSGTGQEKENVRIVNRYRMMLGRQAVKIDERLMRGARGHSIEMRVMDYFAHEGKTPATDTPGKRCAREGYSSGVSENIAWSSGTMSADAAFAGWYHSSGHHRNMVGRGWTDMGVGRSMREGAASYWTQNFGSMTGKSLKFPDALPPPRSEIAPEKDPETADASATPEEPAKDEPAMDGAK